MKNFPNVMKSLGILGLLALVAGCMSNAQFKENELVQAGFKTVPATTPAQQAHLRQLSQTKISPITRNGVQYYVFPDVKQNVLYVGRQPQYNAFRQSKSAMEANQDFVQGAQDDFVSNDAYLTSFATWGAWDGLPWY